jgi:hypothetical protein
MVFRAGFAATIGNVAVKSESTPIMLEATQNRAHFRIDLVALYISRKFYVIEGLRGAYCH